MSRIATETFDFWPISSPTSGAVLEEDVIVRSGASAASFAPGAFNIVAITLTPTKGVTFFYRAAFAVSQLPTVTAGLARIRDNTGTVMEVALLKTGEVKLFNPIPVKNPAGSAMIVPNEYFVIEIALTIPAEGKGTVAWRFNGEVKNAGEEMEMRNLGAKEFWLGVPGALAHGATIYLDDLAVNDAQGEEDNTWLGTKADPIPKRSLLYWGADIAETEDDPHPSEPAPYNVELWDRFEAEAERPVGVVHYSDPWSGATGPVWDGWPGNSDASEKCHAHGAIGMKSLGGPANVIQDVIAGEYDAEITKWAEDARDFGHPFFLRLWWEMNGTWFNWGRDECTGAEYIAAWRHFHDLVRAAGADNVTFVWSPNAVYPSGGLPYHDNPFGSEVQGFDSMYPGDDYVGWVGVDGYTGQNPNLQLGFRTSQAVFLETYELFGAHCPDKPIAICETACSEWATAEGGPAPPKKAEWIRQMLEYTVPFVMPRIQMVLWFNWYILNGVVGDGRVDWPIGSSESAREAFAAGVADEHFVDPVVTSFPLLEEVPLPSEAAVTASDPEASTPERSNMPVVPKLAVPIRTDSSGALAVVEQDSVEEIAASVYALISTERGSRLGDPDYGVEDASFEVFPPDDAIDEWLTQIARYEPRARVRTVAELEDLVAHVSVRVGARA